ncbi:MULTISPECIES: 2-amino-4-hydroxy-6-hydroxymethyldihydropteridine diphosphokinase [Sphingomonas]|uniref:2-amino-4-hydroxy-6- hydroxymethyldihydropteridine diphosphokinase n=1 Tax=Sphingomonas TaxID=13687 RepID=UPI00082FE328|nr:MULTISPECIES: 2-amino-4-hydroxy-6-hydroxymethyldihydropteridine diphosphokinase [Sphingomonas]
MRHSTSHPSTYVVAIGSNRRGRHGPPRAEVAAAITLLDGTASPIIVSAPLGPSTRTFANAAVLIRSTVPPPALLDRLKAIERDFGRRRGRRWGERVIDLDIVLWSGGTWRSPTLTIPHPAFRMRDFVLRPMAAIAPRWRDPRTARTVRQLHARLTRARAVPNARR